MDWISFSSARPQVLCNSDLILEHTSHAPYCTLPKVQMLQPCRVSPFARLELLQTVAAPHVEKLWWRLDPIRSGSRSEQSVLVVGHVLSRTSC